MFPYKVYEWSSRNAISNYNFQSRRQILTLGGVYSAIIFMIWFSGENLTELVDESEWFDTKNKMRIVLFWVWEFLLGWCSVPHCCWPKQHWRSWSGSRDIGKHAQTGCQKTYWPWCWQLTSAALLARLYPRWREALCSHVFSQCTRSSESVVALVIFERLLSCMRPHNVAFQGPSCDARIFARCASLWLFYGVRLLLCD